VNLVIDNSGIAGIESYGQLTGKGPDDVNPVWNDNVNITGQDLRHLLLPGVSISVLKLRLK
jgi:hypothetical protein